MPANTNPIFPVSPTYGYASITLANFAKSGTVAFAAVSAGSSFYTAFKAGINGSRIDQIKVRSMGINAATVLRLFVSDSAGTFNTLIHETSLAAVTGTPGTPITITAQTASSSQFTATSHGLSVGQILYVSSASTLTALTSGTAYYVTSVPSSSTFRLSTLTGTAVSVPADASGASASATPYATLETLSLPDNYITITKNGTETVPPIPYLPPNYRIVATIGSIGSAPANMGWQINVHAGDY